MQKEIFEQPRAVADTLEGHRRDLAIAVRPKAATMLPTVDSVLILACGTSYYSSLVAEAVDRDRWRRFRARSRSRANTATATACPNTKALVVVVSQSGETADTLAALKHAKALGTGETLAICNVRDELDGAPDRAGVPDARRHGDRRRVDQGVHDAARRAVPAGADARQAARPALRRRRGSGVSDAAAPHAGSDPAARWRSSRS